MKRLVLPLAIAVAATGLSPGGAKAAPYCSTVYSVCMDFTLLNNAGIWSLTTQYLSGSGKLTATGIYYDSKPAPDFGLNLLSITAPGGLSWVTGGCNDLNLNSGSTVLLGACGSSVNGITNGFASGGGGAITINFTANSNFDAAVGAGLLDYRAHIQGYGPTNCSLKVDTGSPDNIGTAGTDCVPPNTVPEPVSMLLLASGLGGMAIPALRRRRHKEEQA